MRFALFLLGFALMAPGAWAAGTLARPGPVTLPRPELPWVEVENTAPSREREDENTSSSGSGIDVGGGGGDNFGAGTSQAVRPWFLCNQTEENPVHVAIRYQEQGVWYSSGWHRIDRGKCIRALPNATYSRVQYFAAGKTRAFGGTEGHCVRMSRHAEEARTNCPSGFKKLPFRAVRLNEGETRTDIR